MGRSAAYPAVCLLGLLAAATFTVPALAASTGRQIPDAVGEVVVTDPQLSRALEDAKTAAGKPRLFHENLVDSRPFVQPDQW